MKGKAKRLHKYFSKLVDFQTPIIISENLYITDINKKELPASAKRCLLRAGYKDIHELSGLTIADILLELMSVHSCDIKKIEIILNFLLKKKLKKEGKGDEETKLCTN